MKAVQPDYRQTSFLGWEWHGSSINLTSHSQTTKHIGDFWEEAWSCCVPGGDHRHRRRPVVGCGHRWVEIHYYLSNGRGKRTFTGIRLPIKRLRRIQSSYDPFLSIPIRMGEQAWFRVQTSGLDEGIRTNSGQ